MKTATNETLIGQECDGHGPFLAGIKDAIIDYYQNAGRLPEVTPGEVILRIQTMAHPHYEALWHACTREEQYVLFDIAQDGLVNSKNYQVINALVEKGLLTYNGTLWIMNRSFRNYILTTVDPKQALFMEREALNNGSWSAVRGPLILVVIALASFLFITQQDTYKQIVALLGTLTAIIPIVIRLVGSTPDTIGKGTEKE